MKRHNMKVRTTQTDRTVTVEEVLNGARAFYGDLHKLRDEMLKEGSTKKYAGWATFNMELTRPFWEFMGVDMVLCG